MSEANNAFDLLKEEMESDEIYIRVNAIHRIKIVATIMGSELIKSALLPYIDSNINIFKNNIFKTKLKIDLIKKEEDEVLFALAEQIESLA